MAEYLYVDGERLDAYFEQLSGPMTFEKVPTYGGSMGMTGPSVSATQAAHGREFTRYEKIAVLEAHLNKGGYLGTDRPGRGDEAPRQVFRSEICRSTRVVIPNDHAPLALWICESPDVQDSERFSIGSLYLIEDFRPADRASPAVRTSYSTLRMLVKQVADPKLETTLGGLPNGDDPAMLFSRRPFELVEKLGGTVGDPRTIKVLYRIRAMLIDEHRYPEHSVATIGYPIVVEETATRRKPRDSVERSQQFPQADDLRENTRTGQRKS